MKAIIFPFIILGFAFSIRTQTPQEIQDYFNEVAYGSDELSGPQSQKITKWEKDIKMYITGYYTTQDFIHIKNIVSELNGIQNRVKITITKTKSEANSIVYFGDFKTFDKKYLNNTAGDISCYGYCGIYSSENTTIIDSVKIFICSQCSTEDKKHAIIEEITQSLGLANDSWKYPESIFYEGYTTTDKLSKIDKEVIQMLYSDTYSKN
jgi:hypothetical protein